MQREVVNELKEITFILLDLSFKSLNYLFNQNGMEIFDIYKNNINGGSYRIFARKIGSKININGCDIPYSPFYQFSFSEKISFPFDPLGFSQDINDYFHFSGKLVDVKITEDKMKRFLEKEKIELDLLSNEYIKKMSNGK